MTNYDGIHVNTIFPQKFLLFFARRLQVSLLFTSLNHAGQKINKRILFTPSRLPRKNIFIAIWKCLSRNFVYEQKYPVMSSHFNEFSAKVISQFMGNNLKLAHKSFANKCDYIGNNSHSLTVDLHTRLLRKIHLILISIR